MTKAEIDEFVKANFLVMCQARMAKHLGVSTYVIREAWRRNGLVRTTAERSELCARTNGRGEKDAMHLRLREHGYTNAQIAEIMGITPSMAWVRGKRLGVNPSKEEVRIRRADVGRAAFAKVNADPACVTKRIDTFRRRRKSEELRELVGLPRQTAMSMRKTPRRVSYAKSHLRRRYGYFCFAEEPYAVYYDALTTRLPACPSANGDKRHCERYFADRYGLVFKQADVDDEEDDD